MDPELQKKIDAARAEGYTDEEIQAYLQGQQTRQQQIQTQTIPPPEIAPYQGMDRSEEYAGLAQGMGLDLLGKGLLTYGGYRGLKSLVDRYNAARGAPTAAPQAQPAAAPQAQPAAGSSQAPFGTETEAQRKFSQRFSQPPQAQQGGLLDKTTQMVRQLAANKVLQNAARVGAAGFALTPSSLGPPVPQSGQYRGMEINPNTGRPWTRQELEALR